MENKSKLLALLEPKVNFEKNHFYGNANKNGQRAPNVNPLASLQKLDTEKNFWQSWHQKSILKKMLFGNAIENGQSAPNVNPLTSLQKNGQQIKTFGTLGTKSQF